ERRDRLTGHVHDLVSVHRQDAVTRDEVTDLLAQAQRVYGCLVGVEQRSHLFAVLAVLGAELLHPGRVLAETHPALGDRGQLGEDRLGVADDAELDTADAADFLGVYIDLDELRVGRETRRPALADDEVEAGAHHQDDISLFERVRARAEQTERVIIRHHAAALWSGEKGDAGGFDEPAHLFAGAGPENPTACD